MRAKKQNTVVSSAKILRALRSAARAVEDRHYCLLVGYQPGPEPTALPEVALLYAPPPGASHRTSKEQHELIAQYRDEVAKQGLTTAAANQLRVAVHLFHHRDVVVDLAQGYYGITSRGQLSAPLVPPRNCFAPRPDPHPTRAKPTPNVDLAKLLSSALLELPDLIHESTEALDYLLFCSLGTARLNSAAEVPAATHRRRRNKALLYYTTEAVQRELVLYGFRFGAALLRLVSGLKRKLSAKARLSVAEGLLQALDHVVEMRQHDLTPLEQERARHLKAIFSPAYNAEAEEARMRRELKRHAKKLAAVRSAKTSSVLLLSTDPMGKHHAEVVTAEEIAGASRLMRTLTARAPAPKK